MRYAAASRSAKAALGFKPGGLMNNKGEVDVCIFAYYFAVIPTLILYSNYSARATESTVDDATTGSGLIAAVDDDIARVTADALRRDQHRPRKRDRHSRGSL